MCPSEPTKPTCSNCGKKGPHFVPPSLGEEGFYACRALNELNDKPPERAEWEKAIADYVEAAINGEQPDILVQHANDTRAAVQRALDSEWDAARDAAANFIKRCGGPWDSAQVSNIRANFVAAIGSAVRRPLRREAIGRTADQDLVDLIASAEAYMGYHAEKFYGGDGSRLRGLWPAINRAKEAAEARARGES